MNDITKKLSFLEKSIAEFYKIFGRHNLPWRKVHISPYEVWVSEIMLQQTQVSRVEKYYKNFLERFPDIDALAKSSWEEFLPYYAGLGYYRRGQNMLKTAKKIVELYNGKFPSDKKELMKLSGIGSYTADAILCFAYEKNVLAFDTNLKKIFGRYLCGDKNAKFGKEVVVNGLKCKKKWLNGALMDFSNIICLRKPKCLICPLKEKCKYYKEAGKKEWSQKMPKKSFPTKEAQVFLWLHRDHREYYSPNPDHFEIFHLNKDHNTRDAMKKYFFEKYGLKLSVRPPHKKTYIDNIPTLFVNAQILLGEHEFGVFKKEEITQFTS